MAVLQICAEKLDDISIADTTFPVLYPGGLIKCKSETIVSISDCHIISTMKFRDDRGVLSVFEEFKGVPFRIRRVFFLSEIPHGASRGGHAHKAIHQFVIAISGGFDLVLDDGTESKSIFLDNSDHGVHVVPGVWGGLHNFTTGAICMVLASDLFREDDYIRNYSEFRKFVVSQT